MSDDRPLNKAEILAQLQTTIGQLETVVQKVQSEETWDADFTSKITALQSLSEALTEAIAPPVPLVEPPVQTISEPSPTSQENWLEDEDDDIQGIDRVLPSFNRLQQWWDSVLATVRRLLPKAINEKLSDWGLTSLMAALVVVTLLGSVWWITAQTPEQVADTPATTETVIAEKPVEPSIETIPAPDNLEAPGEPELIELAPPPEPSLTPEQSLLAAIQQEIKDLTRQYPDGLIVAIAPDFDHNRLQLTLAESWSELTPKRQATLANSLFKRTQKLTFQKLFLVDSQGNLLARSPVVGETMILIAPDNSL